MKNLVVILVLSVLTIACKGKHDDETPKETLNYLSFGEKISENDPISKEKMAQMFNDLKAGDTLSVKFASNINEVCQSKGCWMKLDLGDQKETRVTFKDYGFFVPLNAGKKDVIVNGKAYVTEVSVKQQRHYAEDAGKSEEEIAAITSPEITYTFEADGVLIKE